jgi:phosphodiesterase/alkaline phosphatase D-like protein
VRKLCFNSRTVRSALALPAIVGAMLGLPATAAGAGFSLGVAAGDVTTSSAILWTRADASGPVTLRVSSAGRVVQRYNASADPAQDNTVRVRVRRLRPSTKYRYTFHAGTLSSEQGSFETTPRPRQRRTIRFAYSGDADATPVPATGRPFFNQFEVYDRMRVEQNDFNVNLGDTIYSDSGVGNLPPALTLPEKWGKYRQNLGLANSEALRRSTALYSHWDDHEFRNDFTIPEFGAPLYEAGRQAFLDYAPVSYSTRTGLYRRVRWGKNLELFFLDERTFRSAKASAGTACANPFGSFAADLAPTAPQRLRNAFGFAIRPLKKPTPKACLDLIADPKRTFLGSEQLKKFMRDIRRSHATFKVVMNETPIQQFYALPYDRWEGYAAEREKLLRFLKRKVDNVVFLTTDTHANMVNDVRFRTLEPGGPRNSGMLEVVTGPVATNTFAREIDQAVGIDGAGATIGRLFFKPGPPAGVGMRCAALDVYSYAQVEVTARRLTVTPKDSAGKLVREPSGAPCGPFRVRSR